MAVIQPGLFLVLQRYPSHKDALRRLYLSSPSFQTLCEDYQKCTQALEHWTRSAHALALEISRDYEELLRSLENEIEEHLDTFKVQG